MKEIHSIQRVPYHPPLPLSKSKQQVKTTFTEHFQTAVQQQLKLSKHATERLAKRDIEITDNEWQKINDKVFEAHNKGVKQPLVLTEQAALIVNAKNATVITALNRMEAKTQIFTNIDGTIIL